MARMVKGAFREALVLHKLLELGQATKSQLARELDMSPQTVQSELLHLQLKGFATLPRRPLKRGQPRLVKIKNAEHALAALDGFPAPVLSEVLEYKVKITREQFEKAQFAFLRAAREKEEWEEAQRAR